jgi:hypothetical protein
MQSLTNGLRNEVICSVSEVRTGRYSVFQQASLYEMGMRLGLLSAQLRIG